MRVRRLIHASAELLEAMRGELPDRAVDFTSPLSAASNACGVPSEGRDLVVLAFYRSANTEPVAHQTSRYAVSVYTGKQYGSRPLEVNCPACLSLMAEARGPDWDVVQERKEAERQRALEAIHNNDFIDREIEKYHASEFAKRGFVRPITPNPPEPEKK